MKWRLDYLPTESTCPPRQLGKIGNIMQSYKSDITTCKKVCSPLQVRARQSRARARLNHTQLEVHHGSPRPLRCGESSGPGNEDMLPVWSPDLPEGVWWEPRPHGSREVKGLCLLPTATNMYTVISHQASTNLNSLFRMQIKRIDHVWRCLFRQTQCFTYLPEIAKKGFVCNSVCVCVFEWCLREHKPVRKKENQRHNCMFFLALTSCLFKRAVFTRKRACMRSVEVHECVCVCAVGPWLPTRTCQCV